MRADRDGDRRLRLASSSPDVKALFNSPSYIYDLEEQDSPSTMTPGGSSLDYWTPLPPIVSCNCAISTFHADHPGSGLWNSFTQQAYRRCVEARLRLLVGDKNEGAHIQSSSFASKSGSVSGSDFLSISHHGDSVSAPSARVSDKFDWRWRQPYFCYCPFVPKRLQPA